MVMLLLKEHHRKRSKKIRRKKWQKKENALNASIVKEIGAQIGAGTATESEPM